jgi:protein-disulfide isomerase
MTRQGRVSGKMNKTLKLFVIVLFACAVGAGAYYFYQDRDGSLALAEEQRAIATEGESAPQVDVDELLSERVLGDPSAPIRIAEHSSFTCPHCANFHKENFPKLNDEWIKTGRAYLVFSDFPLNAPALHASMVAYCLPKNKFFDFVQMLFEKQDEWAFEGDPLKNLQKLASGYGMDESAFKACVQNTALQDAIVKRMQTVQKMWEVHSTPSFVVNNKTVLSGSMPYENFSRKLEEAAAGTGSE